MKRSMLMVYVKGSLEAVGLYKKAFDAKIVSEHKNEDGSYLHAELDIFGQILAISETLADAQERKSGNIMQFCLDFGQGKEKIVKAIYETLKSDAQDIHFPIGECFYSPLMFGLIDKFGVNWCVFA